MLTTSILQYLNHLFPICESLLLCCKWILSLFLQYLNPLFCNNYVNHFHFAESICILFCNNWIIYFSICKFLLFCCNCRHSILQYMHLFNFAICGFEHGLNCLTLSLILMVETRSLKQILALTFTHYKLNIVKIC